MNFQKILLSCICLICSISILFSQSYSDGPIEIQVKLREVNTIFDATDVGQSSTIASLATPDELSYILSARDNLAGVWTPGICFTDDFTPAYNSGNGTNSIDFNSVFATLSYPNLINPQFLDIKLDAWEDDNNSDAFTTLSFVGITANTSGIRDVWNDYDCQVYIPPVVVFGVTITPGFCLYSDGDDYRCLADPFKSGLDYRLGNPCEWYNHGNIQGDPSACVNTSSDPSAPPTNGYYEPHIETYWRYTDGTSFANSINLGSLSPLTLQHFNSNECYTDYYTASSGNDVIYSFDITSPTGVNISLCGLNGAQFDSYLYLVSDTDTTSSIDMNDNSCGGLQSQITTSICNPGTYYVVVDATAASEFGTFTLEITEDPLNTFSVVDSISYYNGEDISCNSGSNNINAGSDGKFYAHVNGGTPPYTFDWSNGLNHTTNNYNDSITGLVAGNYSVTVTDYEGCALPPLSVTLDEPLPIVVTTNPTPPSCAGYSNGAITVITTSGGTPSYNYSWNTTPIAQSGPNATSLSAAIYTLTVTDDNGCFITHQETLTDPTAPSMSIVSSSASPVNNSPLTYEVCNSNNITLTASGLSSYSWSPNIWLNTNSGPTVTSFPNSPGITYTCTGTDASGCTTDIPIIIDVVSSVSMYASDPSPEVCEGQDISITWYGNPGTSYSWFPATYLNTPTGATVIITPQDTITYTITAQNTSGCTDETKLFVDILSAPTINAVSNNSSICDGSSVQITASGANSYVWSPTSSLNSSIGSVVTASPITNTTYSVVGTALNGCENIIPLTVTISIYPLPNLSVTGSSSICPGESTPLSVSGASSYIWTPSTSLNASVGPVVVANPSTTQRYIITGTDLNGCEDTISHLVSVLTAPNVSVTANDTTICLGNSSTLTASPGLSSYSWSPSSSLNTNTTSFVSATPATTTTYLVVGTDANGCPSSSTPITIHVNPLPVLNVNYTSSIICEGENVSLIVSGANTYVWDPLLGLNPPSGNSVVASPNITTNYIITGTDINDCSAVIESEVEVHPQPTITLSSVSNTHDICEGTSITINAFGAVSYSWDPPFGLNSISGSSVIASPTTSISYTVTGTDGNGCTNNSDPFQLNVGINPAVSITTNNPIICEGESVSLLADGANQYVWTPSNTLSSGVGTMVIATPLISTKYILEGTDILGCVGTDSLIVSVNPLPTANIISGGGILCLGDSAAIIVDVSGNPPWNITYSIDGSVSNMSSSTDPIIIYSELEGTYTIPYISDDNECSNIGSGTEYVDVLNNPQAIINYLPENPNMLDPKVSFINNSVFSNTYVWQFGDNTPNSIEFSPEHTYHQDGTYTVVLSAENGPCVDTEEIQIVIDPYYALYVPNTFSPNGDGTNDSFEPKGTGIESFEIYIYNRWGDEVFYSNNIDISWGGGEGIAGTYTYIISVVDKIGEFHKKNGRILIE